MKKKTILFIVIGLVICSVVIICVQDTIRSQEVSLIEPW